MENNIHGDEEEGADSMMQVIRDLVTLPRGTNATVDNFLDHAILVTIPSMNPDGRFNGQRANQNGFDMNRDWLVQSQAEVRANLKLQVQWLAPVMLATHGYVNPTLVDGLTKPHNPGLEYDVFLYWNQRRLDENQAALARIGQGITPSRQRSVADHGRQAHRRSRQRRRRGRPRRSRPPQPTASPPGRRSRSAESAKPGTTGRSRS